MFRHGDTGSCLRNTFGDWGQSPECRFKLCLCYVKLWYVSTAYSEALGVENGSIIQDKYLTASHHKNSFEARKGRLHNLENAWSAYPRVGTFLEISVGRHLSIITAVATQGVKNEHDESWVLSYKLSYSLWGDEWMEYIDDGEVKVSQSIQNSKQKTKNKSICHRSLITLIFKLETPQKGDYNQIPTQQIVFLLNQ